MPEMTLTISGNLVWQQRPTELNKCVCCNDIIFSDEHVACLEIKAMKQKQFIDLPFVLCDGCYDILKEMNV